MTTHVNVVCQHSTKERRRVSSEVHRQAFVEYGFTYPQPRGAFEVHHLIPLELGGDNLVANLWPETTEPRPGFHERDKVENYLHRQVCEGAIGLAVGRMASSISRTTSSGDFPVRRCPRR